MAEPRPTQRPAPPKAGEKRCLSCGKPESPTVKGQAFRARGANGLVVTVWLCSACASTLKA